MSDLELSDAIDAMQASEAVDAAWTDEDYYAMAQAAVAVVAPLIEAQVRAQIAADIETRADKIDPPGTMWGRSDAAAGMRAAARIARGES